MMAARTALLGDVCSVAAGPSGALLERMSEGIDGIPVVTPSDLNEFQTVDSRPPRRVPFTDSVKLSRFALRAGDIVLVRQGAVGRLAVVGPEQAGWFYGSSCMRLRPNAELILPRFVAECLSHPVAQQTLSDRMTGSMVPSINSSTLIELEIPVPDIDRQWAIVEAIAEVNNQIVTNKAIISRLKALRAAILTEATATGGSA